MVVAAADTAAAGIAVAVAEAIPPVRARCMRPPARAAAGTRKFRSSPRRASPCTAVSASRSSAHPAPATVVGTKPRHSVTRAQYCRPGFPGPAVLMFAAFLISYLESVVDGAWDDSLLARTSAGHRPPHFFRATDSQRATGSVRLRVPEQRGAVVSCDLEPKTSPAGARMMRVRSLVLGHGIPSIVAHCSPGHSTDKAPAGLSAARCAAGGAPGCDRG